MFDSNSLRDRDTLTHSELGQVDLVSCITARYLPNLRYLARITEVDRAVILDLAPMPDRNRLSFINRNRIVNKTVKGPQWLTVPLERVRGEATRDVLVDRTNKRWLARHERAIRSNYPSHAIVSPGFVEGLFETLRGHDGSLLDVNLRSLRFLCDTLSIAVDPIVLESACTNSHDKRHRLSIAKHYRARAYIAGTHEWALMEANGELNQFKAANIAVNTSTTPRHLDHSLIVELSSVHAICTLGVPPVRELLALLATRPQLSRD